MSEHGNKLQELDNRIEKEINIAQKRDRHVEHVYHRVLHIMERIIAIVTIVVLIAELGLEIYRMAAVSGYFTDVSTYLHNILTIVVGLEFVRMLIDTTPANILEVLTLAITRHVILSHDDPVSNLISVACIAGLFAIRRFLIPKEELKEDLVEEN